MKPIILKSHEVIHLRDTGSVIAWRVVKPQPKNMVIEGVAHLTIGMDPAEDGEVWYDADCINPGVRLKCPYGRTGEERWVKETFQPLFSDGVRYKDTDWETGKGYSVRYVATDGATDWIDPDDNTTSRCKPSTHMPRWASRFTVTLDVGLKRIQEVDAFTARSSGVVVSRCACEVCSNGSAICPADASEYALGMRTRVDVSNPGSWDRNDYFWKITCTLKK